MPLCTHMLHHEDFSIGLIEAAVTARKPSSLV